MKLKTRLALIAGAVTFLASLLGGCLLFPACRRAVLDQAASAAYLESREVFQGFQEYGERLGPGLNSAQAAYYLKSRKDDYTVLLVNGEIYYNQTVLSLEQLEQRGEPYGGDGVNCACYFVRGRRLLAFFREDFGFSYSFRLVRLCDITEAYFSVYRLALRIGAISLLVAGLAVLAVLVILRRALAPLSALSHGTRAIANGAYGERVPENGKDEIAGLGRDFNRMAQAVEAHVRQAEENEEKRTLFMGSLTHELKTPLTAISGYAQTLRRVKLSEEDQAEALEYIYRESQRIDRLSKKLLRLLELEQAEALELGPVPVEDLFSGVCRACGPAAEAKGVRLEAESQKGETVNADADLLTEAFINLVDNAVKASAPGSTVRLYTEAGALVVEDQGCGIPKEELGKLTEPFYMVDKSRGRQSGGAGLGLALVAAVLERHAMALHINSSLGTGTKVTVFTI